MALPISTVNIVLRTATVTRQGFGIPLFISSHRNFQERVRTYTSLDAVGEDFNSTDTAYIAASQFFAHTPSVASLKIGRREATGSFAPTNIEAGSVHTITVVVNDGDAVTASYTSQASDTAEDIVTALQTAIALDADVSAHVTASVSGTGGDATLAFALVGAGDVYNVSDVLNMVGSYTSSEVAGDVYDAIKEEDDDFYFVTAEDHTETFTVALAARVQAESRTYFTSSSDTDALTTYSVSATDIPAKLKQGNYTRTAVIYHQDADAKFVECNYVGVNAPYSPDLPRQAVVWDGRFLPGLTISKNAAGNKLSATQQLNLDNRNCSYIVTTNAGDRVLGGKTSGGEWIDNIRTLDCMTARVREGQEELLLNQAGTKVPGGLVGVALVEGKIVDALQPFISSNAISSFTVDTTGATIDQNTRELSGVTFEAILRGAIVRVKLDGSLVNDTEV